jgi:hypothetical protein
MSQPSAEPPAAKPVATEPAAAESRPLLAVVRGEPTAAELAALTVVVGALVRGARQHPATERTARARWAAKDQMVRPQLRPGPGAWRASAAPR